MFVIPHNTADLSYATRWIINIQGWEIQVIMFMCIFWIFIILYTLYIPSKNGCVTNDYVLLIFILCLAVVVIRMQNTPFRHVWLFLLTGFSKTSAHFDLIYPVLKIQNMSERNAENLREQNVKYDSVELNSYNGYWHYSYRDPNTQFTSEIVTNDMF